ncbi:hypothetical protein [Streptomyces sp. yr375]|uniref:hypothetical protein n=1 Tax=Streptomyces sp. yr375 TaxID=1761906 RepID=UPI0011606FCF|nr:hypothetical protein [Streptomyces sp. yr375]
MTDETLSGAPSPRSYLWYAAAAEPAGADYFIEVCEVNKESSPYFAPFVHMVSDGRLGWDAILLAGRGIAAYAAAQAWMLRVGKSVPDPMRLAELIEGFGSAVEQIPDLWIRFDEGRISEVDFVMQLTEIVEYMEAWPGDEL